MDDATFAEKVRARKAELMAAYAAPENITPAESEAVEAKFTAKAKADVKAQEKDAALAKVLEIVKSIAADDAEAMAAVAVLEKQAKAPKVARESSGKVRTSRFAVLDQLFGIIGIEVDETAIFAQFKMGRKDMYWLIADAIRLCKVPEERKWISFDSSTGIYRFEAQSANAPEGWTGYIPSALKAPSVAEEVSDVPPPEENAESEQAF
jgi:hypothetical protein